MNAICSGCGSLRPGECWTGAVLLVSVIAIKAKAGLTGEEMGSVPLARSSTEAVDLCQRIVRIKTKLHLQVLYGLAKVPPLAGFVFDGAEGHGPSGCTARFATRRVDLAPNFLLGIATVFSCC